MSLVDVVIAYTFIRDLSTPFDKTKAFKLGIIDDKGKILRKRSSLSSNEKSAYPSILTTLAWNIKRILSKVGIGRSTVASFASALYLLKEQMHKEGIKGNSPEMDLVEIVKSSIYKNDKERMVNEAFESSLFSHNLERGRYKIFNESVEVSKEKSPFAYSMGVPLYSMLTESGKKLVFSKSDIEEEIPANAVGLGNIAGIVPGEDPPIRIKKKKKKIYELMGRYTVFEVSPEEFEKCTCAKRKFEKWNKFFDEDSETGATIKKYSHHNPEKGIILRNSETGQTMMFRRRWSDQRLTHNRKAKLLTQSQNKAFSIWTR